MRAEYTFVSHWRVPASAARAWAEIERMIAASDPVTDPARRERTDPRPAWWPGVDVVQPATELAPGEQLTIAVRSPLGYRLRVRLMIDDVDPGWALTAQSRGDLRGRGRIVVEPDGDEAAVITFHWDVVTERRWMNATAWLLRPVFERAHGHVMRAGERGIRTEFARRDA